MIFINLKNNRSKPKKVIPKGFDSANDFFYDLFKDKDLIWMGQNTNHLNNEKSIKEVMIDCIKSGEYCKYPAPEGFPPLKKLILEDLSLFDDSFDILVTAGGTESLYVTMSSILDKDSNAITCDPGYLIIDDFIRRFAKELKSVQIYNEECGYKLTPDLVRENLDENTKAVVLIDPLNPLGTAYTEEEIKELADIAIENDLYLVHDITYKDFAREHYLVAKYAPENTITIFSFSKIFGMAGLRIGAIISSHEIVDSIRSLLINDLGTNIVAQTGALAALESKEKWIDNVVNVTRNNQKIIKEAVDQVEGAFLPVYPSDGNMMVIDISETGIDADDLTNNLLKKKVFIRQGSYTSYSFGEKYVRLSFSVPEEEVRIFAKEFIKSVEELRPR